MEETEKIQAMEFTALQQPGLVKKSSRVLRDGQGERRGGTDCLHVCRTRSQRCSPGFGHPLAVIPETGGRRRSGDGKRRKQESNF